MLFYFLIIPYHIFLFELWAELQNFIMCGYDGEERGVVLGIGVCWVSGWKEYVDHIFHFSREKIQICEVNYSRQWVKDLELKSSHPDSQFNVLSLEYSLVLKHSHILLVHLPPGLPGFTREIRYTCEILNGAWMIQTHRYCKHLEKGKVIVMWRSSERLLNTASSFGGFGCYFSP